MIKMCEEITPSGLPELKGRTCNLIGCNGKYHSLTVITGKEPDTIEYITWWTTK
jgi:hypothetical protein